MHSPVGWGALAAGVAALVRPGLDDERAHRFLTALRARYGARDALLTDSGTSALRLAIEGAVAGGARPVALPGYGCYDLASAAEGAGASVALYDLDPTTAGPDEGSLAALAALEPAAVVVVHQFGHVAETRSVPAALGDTLLIEDAAQGVGGRLDGRPLGSFGSLAVLSFGRGKGMTGGGGGALLAHDERGEQVIERVRGRVGSRAPRGMKPMVALAAQMALGRPSLYWLPASLPFLHLGETIYHPPRAPHPAPAASVAVLEHVVARVEGEADARRRNAERLLRALAASPVARPLAAPAGAAGGCVRLAALASGPSRGVLGPSAVRLGVAAGYPEPLDTLPSLRAHRVDPARPLPGARALAERLVTLPTHRMLSERDLQALEAWLGGGS